jgi:hypothetical protein
MPSVCDLCDTFKSLSQSTSSRIREAQRAGLKWSEETNTETLLLTLQRKCPGRVQVSAIEKWREREIGADWEWWFVGPRLMGYPMRVQAKRINLDKGRFLGLWHRTQSMQENQMDTLVGRAEADGFTPAYCFYTGETRHNGMPMGCLLAHAQRVKSVNSSKLKDLASICMPWHEIVCECGHPERGLQQVAAAGSRDMANLKTGRPDWDDDEPYLGGIRRVPAYVRTLLEMGPPDRLSDSQISTIFRGARAVQRRVRGIVVIATED